MIANFNRDWVELGLDRAEYIFVSLTLSYILDGLSLADHDFQNILGMTRAEAEKVRDELADAEAAARLAGTHWNSVTREQRNR